MAVRKAALLLAVAALRCVGALDACTTDAASLARFVSATTAAGAALKLGSFRVWSADASCVDSGDCGNANPTSPYAAATLPSADGTQAWDWSLAPNEVVVMLVCVPPRGRYVGYTPYLHTAAFNGSRYTLFASVADTASAGTAGRDASAPVFSRLSSTAGAVPHEGSRDAALLPFGRRAVLLMGASAPAVAAARALAASTLAPDFAVTVLPIADKYFDPANTFSLYQRYALPDDEAAFAAWLAAPPVAVWSVTPPLPSPGKMDVYPLPTLIPKAGSSEDWLRPAASALSARLADYFALVGSSNVSVVSAGRGNPLKSSAFCIATATNCGGDNRDTTYVQALPLFVLPDDPAALVIVVGANHRATGNGHYANVALYDSDVRLGVVAAADDALRCAPSWLRGTQFEAATGSLYALAISRSCPPWLPLPCLRVPADGWPSAALSHYLTVVERPYSALDTTAGPSATSLVLPQLVLVNIATSRAIITDPVAEAQPLRAQLAGARAAIANMRTNAPPVSAAAPVPPPTRPQLLRAQGRS